MDLKQALQKLKAKDRATAPVDTTDAPPLPAAKGPVVGGGKSTAKAPLIEIFHSVQGEGRFVGASMAVRRNSHIHVEFLYRWLPAPVGREFQTIVGGFDAGGVDNAVDHAEALLQRSLGGRSSAWLRRQRDKEQRAAVA